MYGTGNSLGSNSLAIYSTSSWSSNTLSLKSTSGSEALSSAKISLHAHNRITSSLMTLVADITEGQYLECNTELRLSDGIYIGGWKTSPAGSANLIVGTGGIYVGRNVDPGGSNIAYTGSLISYKNSTSYTGYIFVPLTVPLTSTSWDGDSFSTTAKTLIDLSTVFGAPAGIKAVKVYVGVRDSDSAGTDTYLVLGPTDTDGLGIPFSPLTVNDRWYRGGDDIPCDSNGDIYYQIGASGVGTFDVILQIWGYYI